MGRGGRGLTVRSNMLGDTGVSDTAIMSGRLHANSRLLHEKHDHEHHDGRIDASNTIGPPPWRTRNQETEGKGRQEGRDDEAHSPDVKLGDGSAHNPHELKITSHTMRACRWNGYISVTMYRPVTCGAVLKLTLSAQPITNGRTQNAPKERRQTAHRAKGRQIGCEGASD